MRFMVIVKATKDSEAGVMPSEELLAAMGNFNQERFCNNPSVKRLVGIDERSSFVSTMWVYPKHYIRRRRNDDRTTR